MMQRNDQNQTEGALVPVQEGVIGGVKTLVVDARELHGFLGVGKDFTTWIRGRLKEYGFEQGKDYEVFTKSGENPQGGRPLAEYTLTLDTAKELAMVEKNDKGRQVRRYFLECERRQMHTGRVVGLLESGEMQAGAWLYEGTVASAVLALEVPNGSDSGYLFAMELDGGVVLNGRRDPRVALTRLAQRERYDRRVLISRPFSGYVHARRMAFDLLGERFANKDRTFLAGASLRDVRAVATPFILSRVRNVSPDGGRQADAAAISRSRNLAGDDHQAAFRNALTMQARIMRLLGDAYEDTEIANTVEQLCWHLYERMKRGKARPEYGDKQ